MPLYDHRAESMILREIDRRQELPTLRRASRIARRSGRDPPRADVPGRTLAALAAAGPRTVLPSRTNPW
jgi:hypothetical protein